MESRTSSVSNSTQGLEVGPFEGVGQLGYELVFGRSVRLTRGPAAP